MPSRLKRYFEADDLHFITFSCRERRPFLERAEARDLFLQVVEAERCKAALWIAGYVIMPEHVHVLLAKPKNGAISDWMKSVKQRFARACHRERIVASDQVVWERRYFDFNVFTESKRVEKLRYIHRNPVRRGLVERPEDWKWSSFRFYLEGESYIVGMSERYLECGVGSGL